MNQRGERSYSHVIAKRLDFRRAEYPLDVAELVMKIRAAAYTAGGTNLLPLFRKLDRDNSGSLDFEEFKLVLQR